MAEIRVPKFVESFFADAGSVGLVVLDRRGKVLRTNSYWGELTGRPQKVGSVLRDYLVEFGEPFVLEKALAEPGRAIMLNVQAAGPLPVTLFFRFFVVADEIWAVAEHDPNEAATMRESLVTANNELANLSRQLQKNAVALERLNRTKNELLGVAAHDLRNPLSVVFGMAKILESTAGSQLTAAQSEMLARIKGSSRFLLSLVDDLLDVATIEAGKLKLNLERRSLAEIAERSVELHRFIAGHKEIEIHYHSEPLAPLDLDGRKIEQVFNNLLANAIKFSQPKTAVRVELVGGPNSVQVRVADQGQGIAADELASIFKPFARTSTTSTAGEKSTGLGLAIVHKIVAGHGGETWVESELGRGSTFFFDLPLPAE